VADRRAGAPARAAGAGPVCLEAASEADVDALLALWLVAAENDTRPADTAEAVRTLLARDPEALLIARSGDEVVGSVIAGWDGWRAHLYRLAVHPSWRRRGLGHQLLEAAAERLHALGATRIDAMVLEGNELGQALWRAEGYVPQEEWRRWVRSPRP
jgi:ribosomal protein S18 acetylase RimI-like enzyme